MDREQQKREASGKGNKEQKPSASSVSVVLTLDDLATLQTVIFGYLGFLRNVAHTQQKAQLTLARLQVVYDRLLAPPSSIDIMYFPYDERIAILEAVIGFKMLLVTIFPHTAEREKALVDVERLYQRLISARPLPLN
jgi:hypothetical protein